jgi:hypothetical protein
MIASCRHHEWHLVRCNRHGCQWRPKCESCPLTIKASVIRVFEYIAEAVSLPKELRIVVARRETTGCGSSLRLAVLEYFLAGRNVNIVF